MAVFGITKEYTGLFVNIGGSGETSFKNRTSLLLMYNSKSDFGFTFPVIPNFKTVLQVCGMIPVAILINFGSSADWTVHGS